MITCHTDELVDLLDAGAPTAEIVARLTAVDAACPLMAQPGWNALLARLLVALDRAAARRGRRVSIDLVREKFGSMAVCAGVVSGERSRPAAWVRRLAIRCEGESESRCTICGRRAPPHDAARRWRPPRCGLHCPISWLPLRPDPPELSAHRRLRASAALDARGLWRIAQTYSGQVWRLPVLWRRHDALVSVRADEGGPFVTAALTQCRSGLLRLSTDGVLTVEARLEAAAAAALGLAGSLTSSPAP